MINHYLIHVEKSNIRLKVSYRGGKFLRLERLSGILTKVQLKSIGHLLPFYEEDITAFGDRWQGKVSYQLMTQNKSLYSQFTDEWFSFYECLMGVQYRFNGVDGKALKSIIAYLKAITGDEAQALTLWQALLSSWDKLDDFYKNNADLKFINSQINKILNHVKRTHQKGNGGLSAEYLAQIERDLGAS